MTRGLSIFCLLAAFLGLAPGSLSAAPEVQIHDRVDIEPGAITRIGGQVQIRGRLVERGSGQGAANAGLWIQVDEDRMFVQTDEDGNYVARFPLSEGQHLLTVDFVGGEELDSARYQDPNFDISKSAVSLSIAMPSEISDTESEVKAEITASTGVGDVSLPLEVYFGPANEDLQRIDSITVDEEGRATLVLDQQDLGHPGRKRLELRYAGSEEFDAAQAGKNLTIVSSSDLTLVIEKTDYDYGDMLTARGRLQNGRGNAITASIVTLQIAGQTIAESKTDERGDYLMRIDTEEIGSGSVSLQASHEVSSAAAPSLSKPVRVTIGERKPIPIAYTVAAFALASIALLSFITLRTKPWEKWLAKRGTEEDAQAPGHRSEALPPATGFVPGKRTLRSTLSRVMYSDFHGCVYNVMTSEGIEDATIVVAARREQELRSDAQGRFAITELSAGEYKITVGAHGFVSEHFSVQMPHRGEFHDARVDLLPVREKIFSLYKYAVRKHLPEPGLWGIWTPRQILDHVRKSKPGERLSELTDFVEESFFSQRTPTEDKIDLARAMIRVLDEEATAPRPQA